MAPKARARGLQYTVLSDLRALLGRVRSRGFEVDDRKRAFTFRTGLQRVLLTARVSHSKDSDAFFAALGEMTGVESARFSRQPIGHDFLLQLKPAEPLSMELEIAWISSRLRFERKVLNEHVSKALQIEELFLREKSLEALEKLSEHERELGISLWSTELRLALTQTSQGIDAQKKTLSDIRVVRRKGMWPFLANAASVRAEPSVSIGWFIDENRRRLDRQKAGPFTDYLRYRSIGSWPDTSSGCTKVLRVEQNHHVVDLYETFIAFLQEMSTRIRGEDLDMGISKALENIEVIGDVRVRKLDFLYRNILSPDVPAHELELTDLLFSGGPSDQIRRSFAATYRSRLALESLLALALSRSVNASSSSETPSLRRLAIRGLSQALQRAGYQAPGGGRSDDRLKKLAYVYSVTPFGKAIQYLLNAASSPRTEEAVRNVRIAALNSPSWGSLDLISFSSHPQRASLASLFSPGGVTQFSAVLASRVESDGTTTLRPDMQSLGQALHDLWGGRPRSAAETAATSLSSANRVVAAHSAVLALTSYALTGSVEEASELVSREHVEHGVEAESMPVRDLYEGIEWRDMRAAASAPELSIAMSLIHSTEGDDRLRTYRRFALETILQSMNISRPSELRTVATGWPIAYVIYFLEHVCTSAMLDMLPSIKSSQDVLEERRDICGYLANIDKPRSDHHKQEVLGISREITVLDGLRTIDGSRVHVDKESLTRRLKADLAESFQRYASLSRTSDATSDGIATIVRDFGKEQQPDYLLSMPNSEMDELLVSMFMRARQHFLYNIPHGLDSYISKRIRHGSIVGVIRAPAEREAVVARRNLDGSYRTGGIWSDVVSDQKQRAALTSAIISSSKAIDEHLLRLKDVLLHVKSESKPHGMFDAALTPPAYLVIRSFANSDTSLDGFVDTLLRSLWAMLTPSLSRAQDLLKRESVAFVSDQFHSLRARAQKVLTKSEERAEFDAAAARASVGMQSALLTAASWFEPAESNPRSYTLEEVVAIAVASVRATTAGFAPDLEIISESKFTFSELTLPIVCDVLYVALGNVAAHSNAGPTPKVLLQVSPGEAGTHVTFSMRNQIVMIDQEGLGRLRDKLDLIRADIASSRGEARARTEGGSGLHKLATIVGQVEGDALDFRCVDGWFDLTVSLSYSPARPF